MFTSTCKQVYFVCFIIETLYNMSPDSNQRFDWTNTDIERSPTEHTVGHTGIRRRRFAKSEFVECSSF